RHSYRGSWPQSARRARRAGADEPGCKPDPVPAPFGAGGDHQSGHTVAVCLERSTRRLGRAALVHLRNRTSPAGAVFDLAPGEVYLAVTVTRDAGALLPHPFTLTGTKASNTPAPAVCSLWHCPAGHPGLPLATALLCGVRTFLDRGLTPRVRRFPTTAAAHPTRPHRPGYGLSARSQSSRTGGPGHRRSVGQMPGVVDQPDRGAAVGVELGDRQRRQVQVQSVEQ